MQPKFDPLNHIYRNDAGVIVPSVTQILKLEGVSDFSMVDPETLSAACQFGDHVHAATELHDRNNLDLDALSPALLPYLCGWKKFLLDYDAKIIEIEKAIYHPSWNFAGKLDRILSIKNEIGVSDIKTVKIVGPSAALQTAGYGILYEYETKLKIKFRVAVQLRDDGDYRTNWYKDPNDRQVFLSMNQSVQWKIKNLKNYKINA